MTPQGVRVWRSPRLWLVVAAVLLLGGALLLTTFYASSQRGAVRELRVTVGDVHVVHAVVQVAGREVRGHTRLAAGDSVTTGPAGRARLRLDDGTVLVVAADTRFVVTEERLTLESGRIFVQGTAQARTQFDLAGVSATISASAVALERRASTKLYCAQGELVLNTAGQQLRVASGETATLENGTAHVAPEKAFEDWTGGLAVPWAEEAREQGAIAELRAAESATDAGNTLVVRRQELAAEIRGEMAVTRSRTTYFNGSERTLRPNARLRLPPGAILSRVAQRVGASERAAELKIARQAQSETELGQVPRGLEWAGGGALAGDLLQVASGETLELILEYVEWLPTRADRATYRFPMARSGEAPLVGELALQVDISRAESPWVTTSSGSVIQQGRVELHKSDVKPTGDLVVELAPKIVRPGVARAYVATDPKGGDPFVMVRTEVPERTGSGVALAIVVDTSLSVGASNLETERAVVEAMLEGLGAGDSVVVLAADQNVSPLGPAKPEPATPAHLATIRQALGALRPGGASHLELALERAADALDSPGDAGPGAFGMVVYVGDGRPTLGATTAASLRRTLLRRAGGAPRLGAIAVGAAADRWLLAQLVLGAGSVYEVLDRADAARAGSALLADALEPTLRDVELELGPAIDRIYPREARATFAGSTVSFVGRLRGSLPKRVGFRFRDGKKLIEESRVLEQVELPPENDVARRWAAARVEEIALRGEGIEPAIALALEAKLLTPWTSWFFDPSDENPSVPFAARVPRLSPNLDFAFAPRIAGELPSSSTLLEPPSAFGGGVSLKEAAEFAVRRVLDQAARAVRACRDARAAVRPETPRSFSIDLVVAADGRASSVHVAFKQARGADAVLERCIKGVVQSLPFFAAGTPIALQHELVLSEARTSRRTVCSPASKLSLTIRRFLWRARDLTSAEAFLSAARSCELPSWADRREFLLLLLERTTTGEQCLRLAKDLDRDGETDAATFVRKEALRRVTTFAELQELGRAMLENEPLIDDQLQKAYAKATSDEARLAVVRRFLLLAPHSALARRYLLALLEALGRKEALTAEIQQLRADPFADAGLLAEAASALRRLGFEAEGRRAFGELIERAPRDPWTLAYVGDRLRGEGSFDEAVQAYESLAQLNPDEAAVTLRLALSHAGAGRLDVATRLFERVTQTGGRGDDGRLGELAALSRAVLLARAQETAQDPELRDQLQRRLLETPLPDVAGIALIESPPGDESLEIRVRREKEAPAGNPPDWAAPALGLSAVRIERGTSEARLSLRRLGTAGPARALRVRVAVLVLDVDRARPRLTTHELTLPADGKAVELPWKGEAF